MSQTLLELHEITYSYEDSPFTLHPFSLRVKQGEKIAVLGNNGAGKSTFFLLCNGVYKPDNGSILYRGEKIRHKKSDLLYLREKVGIVFQDPNQQMIASTVESEVSFGPMNLGLSHEEVAQRIDEALQAMQLTSFRKRAPHYLSGGEKKRVTIADVLAMRPEIILFDEPTASLDPAGVEMLEGVLSQLEADGKTLLISTHDIDFAWRWASRIVVFSDGYLIADDTPETVFADDKLLHRADLRRPYLYDVARLLQQQNPSFPAHTYPKTIAELGEFLQNLSIH